MLTEVEKALIAGLKIAGVGKGNAMVICLQLRTETQQMDMLEFILENETATENEIMEQANRIATQQKF